MLKTNLNHRFNIVGFFVFASLFFLSCQEQVKESSKELVPIWADEFDYNGFPDSTKWGYDVGDGCPNLCGWGNNEKQYYTSERKENVRVENGKLIIQAHKEDFETRVYTSTKLISKNKGDWKYGRIEISAKLPSGVGTWPAIWMLPTDWEYGGWPKSGEIDIMEHVGYNPDSVFGTVHTYAFNHMEGTQKGGALPILDAEKEFHLYAIEWTEDKIDFFIDDQMYFTFENERKTFSEYPFDKRFYLILNLAVGGNWGGREGIDDSIFPQQMEIDYVRVYDINQMNNLKNKKLSSL